MVLGTAEMDCCGSAQQQTHTHVRTTVTDAQARLHQQRKQHELRLVLVLVSETSCFGKRPHFLCYLLSARPAAQGQAGVPLPRM